MSARLGTPFEVNLTVGAVGASFFRSITVSPSSLEWSLVNVVFAQWVASATVGNRQLAVRVRDSAGLVLGIFPASSTIPASQTANVTAGMGQPSAAVTITTTTYFSIPLPGEFAVPSGSTIDVIDLAGISNTDTLLMNAILVY